MIIRSGYQTSVPGLLALFLLLALVFLASAPDLLGFFRTGPSSSSEGQKKVEINPSGYTSASVCGECHVDIYASWKNSLHAFSLTDPIFDAAFMQAIKSGGDSTRKTCLRCHAPMTMLNEDYMLEQGVSREGVSCDFCHTVTAVHLDGRDRPYTVSLSTVKRSVLRKASSPAHDVAFSELHGTSEFCGGCHNYTSALGAQLFTTYDEWREGPYPQEGVQCQNCHMVLSKGNVVAKEVQESPAQIHLHSLIHDRDQLRGALAVKINRVERKADSLSVEVEVDNVGSGHKVPTGLPSREVALVVSAQVGGRTLEDTRRYRKIIGDAHNRPIDEDFNMFLRGVRILKDNRIGPREKRIEQFIFHGRPSGPIQVNARLVYQYRPTILGVQNMSIDLGQAERAVP